MYLVTVGKRKFLTINLCTLNESTCKDIMDLVNEERLISGIGNIAHKCQI
jgi:hypothetical protein